MTEEREIPPASDPLDELLRRALWPEPTPLQMSRLESSWNRTRPQHRNVTFRTGIAAAAAVLLVGLAVWSLLPTTPNLENKTRIAIDEGNHTTSPSIEPLQPVLDDRNGRPPTRFELAFLQAAEHRTRRERHLRETDPLERAVAQLIDGSPGGFEELEITSNDAISLADRIIEELPISRGQRRNALVRLLVWIEPPDSLPVFLSLWSDPLTRGIVEPTVIRLADVPTLAKLIWARQSFDDRVRLLREIGSRPDVEAQSLLIEAAISAQTRPAVLAAARHAVPPTELLVSALSHEHADVRVAAALLLGEHSDPQITVKLVAMARRNPAWSEPWIALLQRDDAEALAIIHEARRHPQIFVSVNLAEFTRQMAVPQIRVGVAL